MCLHQPLIMRLPYDVLWYMFGFILSDDVSRSPTTISHLCRSWRLAALQTPFLWSHITMVLGHDMNQKNELAQSRFERADNHPIDLTIRARRHFSDAEKSQLILPNAHRLRRLTIESFLGQFSLPLLWDAFPRRMPLLDEFYGLSMPETRVHMIRKPAARFSDSEEFSSLIPFGLKDLNPHRLSFVTCDVYCPKNLTTIVLAPTGLFLQPTLSDIHRILSGTASTLQHFEYEGPTPYLCSDTKYKPIEFPDLYSISIGYSDDVVPFLCFFKAPGLKRLDLLSFKHSPTTPIIPRTYGQQIPTNPKKLLRVISQWKSLHHLGLFAIGELPANATLQYIQCLDSLEYLVLYHAHSFAKVLCSQGSNKSSILLPNLKNLLYTAAGYESQLLSFLKARNSHNLGPLECLVVDIDPKFLDARAGRLSVEDLDVLRTGSRFLKLFTCQSYVSVEPQQWFWGETSV